MNIDNIIWADYVDLTVEAAFSADDGTSGIWDSSLWDGATWGPDIIWTEITDYTRSISTTSGRDRSTDHFNASTSTTVLEDVDGRFLPENTTGPYAVGGVNGVRPWRPFRIVATELATGIRWGLHWGYTQGFDEDASLQCLVTVTTADNIERLSRFDGYEQPDIGGDELTGTRVHRILDNAAYTGDRDIDLGATTMQATNLSQNAWTELLLTADSDGGEIWQDPNGTIVFEDVTALWENARSNTSQATFSDDPTADFPYESIGLPYDGDQLINISALARAGSTVQVVDDLASRALFGDHRFSRSDLICTDDAQVVALANRDVTRYAYPQKRIDEIVLNPIVFPALWPHVLGRRIRDRITVENHHRSGNVISRDCFIDGIGHEISETSWLTRFKLSSADWIPDGSELGVWDDIGTLWDGAKWSW